MTEALLNALTALSCAAAAQLLRMKARPAAALVVDILRRGLLLLRGSPPAFGTDGRAAPHALRLAILGDMRGACSSASAPNRFAASITARPLAFAREVSRQLAAEARVVSSVAVGALAPAAVAVRPLLDGAPTSLPLGAPTLLHALARADGTPLVLNFGSCS